VEEILLSHCIFILLSVVLKGVTFIYVIIQFNSILVLSIKTPITEQYNHMKNMYIKKRDVIYSDLYFNVLEGARVAQ
jgi:hypothetical protein